MTAQTMAGPSVLHARVKLYYNSEQYAFHVDSTMNYATFLEKVENMCDVTSNTPLVLKYIDDENDPILLASDEELEEMLRLTCVIGQDEPIYLHAFGGRPPEPGKLCEGENKAIYRRNAQRWNKLKRHFKRKLRGKKMHDIPIQPSPPQQPHTHPNYQDQDGLDYPSDNNEIHENRHITHQSVDDAGVKIEGNQHVNKGFGFNDFDLIKVIGRGSYAKVLLVRLKQTQRLYAMKVIKKELVCDEEDIDWVQTEKHVFETASNHPFLVGLHSCFQSASRLFFVIEYINGGDLMFHMQRQRKLPEEHARFYSAEITLALHFLHDRGIIYRDLKLDNVLLDSEGHIRLTDYGMCKEGMTRPGDVTSTFCGTPNYIAPEILRGDDYSFSVDWWALGVLMYEMMAGRSPFDTGPAMGADNPDQNTEELLFQVILERVIRIPRSLSVRASKVLKGFLNKNPEHRLGCEGETGFQDIVNHDFFRTIDWRLLEEKQLSPPYKPYVRDEMGLDNFDTQFTEEPAQLTPDQSGVVDRINQKDFEGFEYVNPLLMTVEDTV